MASIENRSRIQVTVKNRDDLTKQFAHNADKAIEVYVQKLRAEGLKPRLASLNDQLMTGARRSETLTLTWSNVNLDAQTAYLPETKNGRARKLPLRLDLVEMLHQLPRNGV